MFMDKLPDMPVKLLFDPEDKPELRDIWNCPAALTLYLLWRPCHIVNQHFNNETLAIGLEIERKKPTTIEDLKACFGLGGTNYLIFSKVELFGKISPSDVDMFVELALPYFVGEKEVSYEVN